MPLTFDDDAFISYSHIDNVAFEEHADGWVSELHLALERRLAQLLGQSAHIWRDLKLEGNDVFGDLLVERLRHVAALVSVVSPAYVKSDWCRKELAAFCKAAAGQGGLRIGSKSRLFKVLKTPVPLEQHPAELREMLGYEFFRIEEDGRLREFSKMFGPDAETDFWIMLNELANGVVQLLQALTTEPTAPVAPKKNSTVVYLATTTADLKEQRERIKRELEQHGHVVLPDRPLPLDGSELQAAVRADLERSRLSIHMFGRAYGMVPEGQTSSVLEIQSDLAAARAAEGGCSRLIWIPEKLQIDDERQRRVVEQLRMNPRMPSSTDLLETSLEDLRTTIAARLAAREERPAPPPGSYRHVYLIYDQRDAATIKPWVDFLFTDFEVIHPEFEGDEAQVRAAHEENLRICEGILIFYGAGTEFWLRQKIREIQKSPGYGRTKPRPVVGVCLIAPRTPQKDRFATHDALVITQMDGFSPEPLAGFVSDVKGAGENNAGDGVENAV